MSGLGGDGFYHVWLANSAKTLVYNGTGTAPKAALKGEIFSKHVVKIYTKNNQAETFYRTKCNFKIGQHFKHIGLYGFRFQTLKYVCSLPVTQNEKKFRLEQLRWLENGIPINVAETTIESISIDTPQDLKKITNKIEFLYKKHVTLLHESNAPHTSSFV